MIYFIETQGLVKIGYSNDPRRRFSSLTTGCPTVCTLIGVTEGGKEEEGELHSRFSHLRVRGEWFKFAVEVNDFLRENAIPLNDKKEPATPKVDHPVSRYLSDVGESASGFCIKIGISRAHLYRIMSGHNTTTRSLKAISIATGGIVKLTELVAAVSRPA